MADDLYLDLVMSVLTLSFGCKIIKRVEIT